MSRDNDPLDPNSARFAAMKEKTRDDFTRAAQGDQEKMQSQEKPAHTLDREPAADQLKKGAEYDRDAGRARYDQIAARIKQNENSRERDRGPSLER